MNFSVLSAFDTCVPRTVSATRRHFCGEIEQVQAYGSSAVRGFAEYEAGLQARHVVPDAAQRMRLIEDGIAGLAAREGLARASSTIRDRLVRRLMEGGVTFLLPEAVMVDVDVQIGRDTVVYPWCVLEGKTTIGEETVIGPCCRVDSCWIGSGVELKGFNYLSHTSLRPRAILEPYVRRGFDE